MLSTLTNSENSLRSKLFASASGSTMVAASVMVSALSFGGAAVAQTVADASVPPAPEEIVVTGIRSSLQKNLDIKRDATGLIDAISATDIGQFPDSDLADAMQRIPGVTVSRGSVSAGAQMGGAASVSNGDATGYTVRGFGPQFNVTLFDGRQLASTNGRAVDMSSLGADFVKELDVLKSPDAALSSGAIGATVNVQLLNPLDHKGLLFSAQVSGTEGSWEGPTPNGNVIISDTFGNHDQFGILVAAGYSATKTLENSVNNRGFSGTPTSALITTGVGNQLAAGQSTGAAETWHTIDYDIFQDSSKETRKLGRIALQWKPLDSVTITVDDNFSRQEDIVQGGGVSWWFNNPASQLGNIVRDANGTVTSFNSIFNYAPSPLAGPAQYDQPTDFDGIYYDNVVQNNDTGINIAWKQTNKLKLVLDYDHSQAWLNPGANKSIGQGNFEMDLGYGPSVVTGTNGITVTAPGNNGNAAGVVLPGPNALPYPISYGPNNVAAQLNNPLIFGTGNGVHIFNPKDLDTINQYKVAESYSDEDTVATLGVQYVSDNYGTNNFCNLFCGSNNTWQAYPGYGPNSANPTGAAVPASLVSGTFKTGSNFITGLPGANNLPAAVMTYNARAIVSYLQGLGNPQTKTIPGYSAASAASYAGVFYGTENASSYSHTIEDTASFFATYQKETKVADMPLRINLGLREDLTRLKAVALGTTPTGLSVLPADHTAFLFTFSAPGTVTGSNSYQYMLPNLDLSLEVTPDTTIRFDASRSLSRPPIQELGASQTFGGRVGGLTLSGGNPALLPYTADNFDLSGEWYYAKNSYISLDGFVKDVNNFPVSTEQQKTMTGLIDPTTGAAAVATFSSNFNGPSAWVYGGEFQIQHTFGDTGFGVQANATLVGTNKPYNPTNFTTNAFAVTGLADSTTIVAFYDKKGFQARVAYTWRADQLQKFGQPQGGSGTYGAEPVYEEATNEVDFTTSYNITKQLSVFFSALNLADANYITHGRFTNQILDVVDYGRTYRLGVHFKL